MRIENINLDDLHINRANDRHGELENETAAIAQLFRLKEGHMKKLAQDISEQGRLYELPLIWPGVDDNIVFDGNRRITALKLIRDPRRAPTQELQDFFTNLQELWDETPVSIECELEDDREVIDEILYRRHTGSQGGVGQSTWDDRAKRNFVDRSGKNSKINVADEIERILDQHNALPENQIPRSTINRLLSSEVNRNRVGVSLLRNQFSLTHEIGSVLPALTRMAQDFSEQNIVLGDIWNNEGKQAYLNRLELENLLPRDGNLLPQEERVATPARRPQRVRGKQRTVRNNNLIPSDALRPAFTGDQARIRAVWDELGSLSLNNNPNAISALLRILLELSLKDYLARHEIQERNELTNNFRLVYDSLRKRDIIEQAYVDELARMREDELISIRSMQRYVHSPRFAPMPNELQAYWTRLGGFLIHTISN